MQKSDILTIPLGTHALHISKTALRRSSGWNVQRHCNAEWEFHYIKSGTCQVDIGATHYRLSAGQALLIEPGLYHQAKTIAGDFEMLTLCFSLTKGDLYRQLSAKLQPVPVFQPDPPVLETAHRILTEYGRDQVFSTTYLEALTCCMMVELMRFLQVTGQPQPVRADTDDTQLTQIIDTYFEQHFSDSAGEAELAKLLHFSRRHLVRILQKHYGMNFREKLTQARMDYAALLLRTTDKPVSVIGTEIGYGSESAFFKVFRRCYDMTPRQYRTRNK